MITLGQLITEAWQPYYLANALLLCSYPLFRLQQLSASALADRLTWTGLTRELEVTGFFAIVLMSRARKAVSAAELLGRVILFAKILVFSLFCYLDWRYGAGFLLLCLVTWIVFPRPRYRGTSSVVDMDVSMFDQYVRHPEGDASEVVWMVAFNASWCEDCTHFEPVFASASVKYMKDNFNFARIDVASRKTGASALAEEFNIDATASSRQLPTIIMFRGGHEVARIPFFNDEGKVVKLAMNEETLKTFLEHDHSSPARPVKSVADKKNKKGTK